MTSLHTPPTCTRLDHGPGGDLAAGPAGDELRELAPEVDELLDEQRPGRPSSAIVANHSATSAALRTTRTPLPS